MVTMKLPTVTVVLPTWNRTSFIDEAIDSVLSQGYRGGLDLVVVDDGSEQPAEKVLTKYRGHLRILRTAHRGLAHARLAGSLVARGELIGNQDDDDVWLADKLERQVDFLMANPSAGMVWCDVTRFSPGGPDSPPVYLPLPRHRAATALPANGEGRIHPVNSLVDAFLLDLPPYAQSMLFRKSFLERIGNWDPARSALAELYPVAYRATREGDVGCIPEPLVRIRRGHPQVTGDLGACRVGEARDLYRWAGSLPRSEQAIVLPRLARRFAARAWQEVRRGNSGNVASVGWLAVKAALRRPGSTMQRPWLRPPESQLAGGR